MVFTDTVLSWRNAAGQSGSYNIHMSEVKSDLIDANIRVVVPAWTRVFGNLPDVTTIQTPPTPSSVLFVKVYQNDGCPSAWSLMDP